MFELDNFDLILWHWPVWFSIFHLKVIEVVNSCCCLVRILYFYSSYKIDFKFWKSLRTNWYVEGFWWMIWRRWINSFTVFTIHRTTKDLNKSGVLAVNQNKLSQQHNVKCILTSKTTNCTRKSTKDMFNSTIMGTGRVFIRGV